MFDRQKIILTFNKYTSYLINILLIGIVGGAIYFWVSTLVSVAH